MTNRATWLLAGGFAVGSFAAGKAVVDHALARRAAPGADVPYDPRLLDNLVAWTAIGVAIFATWRGVPTIFQEATRLVE